LGNVGLALLAAGLLILAFPDFELWFLAWFALVPLLFAIERQAHCVYACALLGWIFGTVLFFGTCWWLTYAPIHYAAVPWPLAYFLIFIVCVVAGLFPAIFTTILSVLLRRFGSKAFLGAPFVWVFTEFLRYWLTGNNWNAIGYSQAFVEGPGLLARVGGVSTVGGFMVAAQCILFALTQQVVRQNRHNLPHQRLRLILMILPFGWIGLVLVSMFVLRGISLLAGTGPGPYMYEAAKVVAIQPNVPMSGLTEYRLMGLRGRQAALAEMALMPAREQGITTERGSMEPSAPARPITVIFPESPMNFMYSDDREFQQFIGDFARRNNVSVLFNSAEPDKTNGKYFNSAVMVGPDGREAVQYDKVYLLPFGEAVPPILEGIVPGFVGNFSYGGEYDLFPLGGAKAGVMICFESHFGQLSREYVRNGADVLIEMTNDGYLGPTPVLRQHLANAVFRAVETNRPVLRVTNVGITAYINESGQVLDEAPSYTEATRVWSVAKSDGSQTFYVKYGDWFAWLCSVVTIGLLGYAIFRRRQSIGRDQNEV